MRLSITQRIGLWILTKKINSIADKLKGGDTMTTTPVATDASKRFSLNWTDAKKVFIGAGIALLGAAATYMQDTIPGVDFGVYTPIAYALNSMAVNAIRKFIQNYGSIV